MYVFLKQICFGQTTSILHTFLKPFSTAYLQQPVFQCTVGQETPLAYCKHISEYQALSYCAVVGSGVISKCQQLVLRVLNMLSRIFFALSRTLIFRENLTFVLMLSMISSTLYYFYYKMFHILSYRDPQKMFIYIADLMRGEDVQRKFYFVCF